jgi:hypothetical protein
MSLASHSEANRGKNHRGCHEDGAVLIVLNGYPGVGKLAIGRELAELTGGRLLDVHTVSRFLAAGLASLWPRIRTVIADAGYESGALAQHLDDEAGWELRIIKRPRPGFEIVGPNWIVERTFARASADIADFPRTTSSASRPRRLSSASLPAPLC